MPPASSASIIPVFFNTCLNITSSFSFCWYFTEKQLRQTTTTERNTADYPRRIEHSRQAIKRLSIQLFNNGLELRQGSSTIHNLSIDDKRWSTFNPSIHTILHVLLNLAQRLFVNHAICILHSKTE